MNMFLEIERFFDIVEYCFAVFIGIFFFIMAVLSLYFIKDIIFMMFLSVELVALGIMIINIARRQYKGIKISEEECLDW